MVTNIDSERGTRSSPPSRSHGLSRDTIVIFLTDNGPAEVRFNAGLRAWKGSVYDGGIMFPSTSAGRLTFGRVAWSIGSPPISTSADLARGLRCCHARGPASSMAGA